MWFNQFALVNDAPSALESVVYMPLERDSLNHSRGLEPLGAAN